MFVFSVGCTVVVAATALGRIGAVSLARFSLDHSRGGCGGRVEARTLNASMSTHAMITCSPVDHLRWQVRVLVCWCPSAAKLTRTIANEAIFRLRAGPLHRCGVCAAATLSTRRRQLVLVSKTDRRHQFLRGFV